MSKQVTLKADCVVGPDALSIDALKPANSNGIVKPKHNISIRRTPHEGKMWIGRQLGNYVHDDSVTGSVAAVLLCSIIEKRLLDRESEFEPYLYSEALAWTSIYILWRFRVVHRGPTSPQANTVKWAKPPLSNVSLWLFSTGLVIYCLFAAEDKASTIFPALGPFILLAAKLFNIISPPTGVPRGSVSWICSPLANTLWGSSFAAICTIIALKWPSYSEFGLPEAISSIPLLAKLVLFVSISTLGNRNQNDLPLKAPSHFDIDDLVVPLSWCVTRLLIIAILMCAVAFGFPQSQLATVLVLGLSKTGFWHFAFIMVCTS